MIALSKRFGSQRLEAACARALVYDTPKYRTVKTILDNNLDLQPVATDVANGDDDLAEPYTGSGRFCRDTTSLLTH